MYVMYSLSHNFLKKHSKYVAPKHDLVQLIDDYWLGSSLTIKSSSSWSRDQTIQYTYQYRSLIQKKMDSTTWNKWLVSQILLGHFTEEYSFRLILSVKLLYVLFFPPRLRRLNHDIAFLFYKTWIMWCGIIIVYTVDKHLLYNVLSKKLASKKACGLEKSSI